MPCTRIKICGLKTEEDIQAANACKPDFVGFVLSEGYKRSITMEQAAKMKKLLAPGIEAVGVFVDEPYERIAAYLKAGIINRVQLHGNEDGYYIRQLRKVMLFQDTIAPIIKSYTIRTEKDVLRAEVSCADDVLLDNGKGTGQSFDWSLLGKIDREYWLAGGLTPENVAEAIDALHPKAVDMSSGVETLGSKDPIKMMQAVETVKAYRRKRE